jgi:double-GTPase-like protein
MTYAYSNEYIHVGGYLPCPLCGEQAYEGQACGTCYLPAKVIESIRARSQTPRFVGVLGPSAVGKTVYLGMLLDLLARGVGGLRGVAQSPFSLTLHRNLILALERQRFPEKTPVESDRWHWVHCEVYAGKGKSTYDIVTPDVAGEAVMAELENPGSDKTIRALIGRCAGLVILVDVINVIAEGQGQELFAMQLVSYLDTLKPRKRNCKLDVPVAIVFTKTDLCDGWIRDPEAFARANVPELYGQCQTRLDRFRFYFSGVAGSTGRLIDRSGQEMLIPLRIEPRGVIEPFAWMVKELG